ncbi:MAG: anthranilate synthase component I [Candidatus Omnitrophota bacterium]
MYSLTEQQFIKLSKKGNLIPIYKEIDADLDTPVSCYLKIAGGLAARQADGEYSFLLESVEGQEKTARFSFISSSPRIVFRTKANTVEIIENGHTNKFKIGRDPLEELKKIMQRYNFVDTGDLPRFCGGLVGFIGYDIVKFFEPKLNELNIQEDDLKLPDSLFLLTDAILIFDHLRHKIKIIYCAHIYGKGVKKFYKQAVRKIEELIKKIKQPLCENIYKEKSRGTKYCALTSNFTQNNFIKAVNKAKEYIRKGDIIQVVLSQRFKIKINKNPFLIYRNLRMLNPSPYMYYLKLKDLEIIGSSPELLVRQEDNVVVTRPIAGTRPRGKDEQQDSAFAKELLNDKKERAEHLMLVDLGRNDLGRICDFGTVKMNEFMIIERYSHVMHIVSEVKGRLKKDKDNFDVMRAVFPAGTVSGAPKVRAMEIINELEKQVRGPYAGAIGYFSFSGNVDTCITIRTIVINKNFAYIQAGAGIVADSDPKKEYQETVNKAKAQLEAIVN